MALIHHDGLRVNSEVPDDTVDIWVQQGWTVGPHPDTDPDDDYSNPPSVLPLPEPTKAELLEQAKALEVEGRSSMNKDELAAAVADATTQDQE